MQNHNYMLDVVVRDCDLRKAADEGMDDFLKVFTDAIYSAIGGTLDAEAMAKLNASQITLLAYDILRTEVMDGGFVQLIYNGYGGFIFVNPFAKAVRQWGIESLASLIKKAHKLYSKYHKQIEVDCTDEEFMAMFERMPEFDACDDAFVESEAEFTTAIAEYVDGHIADFATIDK